MLQFKISKLKKQARRLDASNPNMKAIRTKYHGPTNTRGSRITASDEDGNKVTIPYPHELSGEEVHRKAALALCRKMNWTGQIEGGGLKDGYAFVFTSSSPAPLIHQVEMSEGDIAVAQEVAARMGYGQTAYTSTSGLWGLFCLPENPATWKGKAQALTAGCVIKTKQFGFLFVADLEDMHMDDLNP